MTLRLWLLILFTVVAASVVGESINESVLSRQKYFFEVRSRCIASADNYAKAQATEQSSVSARLVDFSPSRDSCVASVSTRHWGPGAHQKEEVLDVMTRESLFFDICNIPEGGAFCTADEVQRMHQASDKVFYKYASLKKAP